jgi:hypothetical protein
MPNPPLTPKATLLVKDTDRMRPEATVIRNSERMTHIHPHNDSRLPYISTPIDPPHVFTVTSKGDPTGFKSDTPSGSKFGSTRPGGRPETTNLRPKTADFGMLSGLRRSIRPSWSLSGVKIDQFRQGRGFHWIKILQFRVQAGSVERIPHKTVTQNAYPDRLFPRGDQF